MQRWKDGVPLDIPNSRVICDRAARLTVAHGRIWGNDASTNMTLEQRRCGDFIAAGDAGNSGNSVRNNALSQGYRTGISSPLQRSAGGNAPLQRKGTTLHS